MSKGWDFAWVPELSGRTVVITGANSGIGLEAARMFSERGAEVVLACRSEAKAHSAMDSIAQSVPDSEVAFIPLDLASLGSVHEFSQRFLESHGRLDVLVNNAGVMALPRRSTEDGFEMQFGTNHLGHFALTGLLAGRLLETPGSRVVNVSSFMHKYGRMRFSDLNWERAYNKWAAYGMSKLANLLFTHELDRRLKQSGASTISVACHPGWASTNLISEGPRMSDAKVMGVLSGWANATFAQSAVDGALPTLFASVEPLEGGEFVGPDGFRTWRGTPVVQQPRRAARDHAAAAKLWEASESMTGVRFELRDAQAA